MRNYGLAALANALVLLHLSFVLFVVFGGVLVMRWRRIAWIHIPAVLYGVAIELVGWTCPLTPLEQHVRQAAGEAGYQGPFLDHYVGAILYPHNWSQVHLLLGVGVMLLNAWVYARLITR